MSPLASAVYIGYADLYDGNTGSGSASNYSIVAQPLLQARPYSLVPPQKLPAVWQQSGNGPGIFVAINHTHAYAAGFSLPSACDRSAYIVNLVQQTYRPVASAPECFSGSLGTIVTDLGKSPMVFVFDRENAWYNSTEQGSRCEMVQKSRYSLVIRKYPGLSPFCHATNRYYVFNITSNTWKKSSQALPSDSYPNDLNTNFPISYSFHGNFYLFDNLPFSVTQLSIDTGLVTSSKRTNISVSFPNSQLWATPYYGFFAIWDATRSRFFISVSVNSVGHLSGLQQRLLAIIDDMSLAGREDSATITRAIPTQTSTPPTGAICINARSGLSI